MKKNIVLTFCVVLFSLSLMAKEPPIGLSVSLFKEPDMESLKMTKDAGIDYIEVTMNYFWRNVPKNECYTRAFALKKRVEEVGLKVWSCHLPFSRELDISVLDIEKRQANIALMERMIRLAGIFNPRCLILHPSSEPISEEERETRIQNSKDAIGRLSLAAKDTGITLCIENLPRTCLGRDSEEIIRLIEDYPEVMACFDTNHLLVEEQADFMEKVGNRIGTVHISDYDRKDERHWLPGKGVIDWSDFYASIKRIGYKGVMMHELHAGEASPEHIVKTYRKVVLNQIKK